MSGRVLVDDEAAGDPLLYASNAENPAWHRFGVRFADGGSLYLRDPRRLGAVELDPDEERLGLDALDAHGSRQLRRRRAAAAAPLKAVLMDQAPDRRARQPARRRGRCGGPASTRPARPTRSTPTSRPRCTGRSGRRCGFSAPRRLPHRRSHGAARARRPLPPRRRPPGTPDGRRSHDLLLPPAPASDGGWGGSDSLTSLSSSFHTLNLSEHRSARGPRGCERGPSGPARSAESG